MVPIVGFLFSSLLRATDALPHAKMKKRKPGVAFGRHNRGNTKRWKPTSPAGGGTGAATSIAMPKGE